MTTSTEDLQAARLSSSSWPMPAVEPDQPATTATVAILRALFDVMLKNEEGVRLGLDPECLHDFRVAVRRTRSALGEIQGILPHKTAKPFRRAFSRLARATGPTRDLDVFLLALPAYESLLPNELAPGLAEVRDRIEGLRRSAHRRLVAELESEGFAQLRREWPALLHSATPQTCSEGGRRPIAEVAERRIERARRRAVARARAIGPSSPDRHLHRLRLTCKTLRYLQEFFRALFPADEIQQRIEKLKSLQDILGDFNDLSVQRKTLRGLMDAEAPLAPQTSAAVTRLDELLKERRQEDRQRVERWVATWQSGSRQGDESAGAAPASPHLEST